MSNSQDKRLSIQQGQPDDPREVCARACASIAKQYDMLGWEHYRDRDTALQCAAAIRALPPPPSAAAKRLAEAVRAALNKWEYNAMLEMRAALAAFERENGGGK